MLTNKIKMLILGMLFVSMSTTASAGLIVMTNSDGGVVDNSMITQSLDITDNSIITDIDLTVDFSKCDGSANANGCLGSGGSTFNGEISFSLAFMGIDVDLVIADTFSGQSDSTRVTQTYDDEAGTAVGGSLLLDGSFTGVEMLSVFDGLSAFGLWSFTFGDDASLDPMVVHSWTLSITTEDAVSVSEPATLGLMGIAFIGFVAARRRVS